MAKSSASSLVLLLLLGVVALANGLLSPDGSCGPTSTGKFTCTMENCCGMYGWCGNSTKYCGDGCNSAYGVCQSGGGGATPPTSSPPTSDPPSASPTGSTTNPNSSAPSGSGKTSPDGSCGRTSKGKFNCEAGYCCSPYGYCGNDLGHCGYGCQTGFGQCGGGIPTPSPPGTIASSGVQLTACAKPGQYALTFDDGPSKFTDHVLDVLKKCGVKASFFALGVNLDPSNPGNKALGEAFQRADKEGHTVCSHSYDHPHFPTLTKDQMLQQLNRTSDIFFTLINKRPRYFRPPYGEVNNDLLDILKQQNTDVILWNLDTLDWQSKDQKAILSAIDSALATGNPSQNSWIDVKHDTVEATGLVLDKIIKDILSKGYKLVTVNECVGDKGSPYQ